jgi:hypothetical protein
MTSTAIIAIVIFVTLAQKHAFQIVQNVELEIGY